MSTTDSDFQLINTQALETPFTISSYGSASLLPHPRVLRQITTSMHHVEIEKEASLKDKIAQQENPNAKNMREIEIERGGSGNFQNLELPQPWGILENQSELNQEFDSMLRDFQASSSENTNLEVDMRCLNYLNIERNIAGYCLGAGRNDSIVVENMVHHLIIPEYPESSEKGIGHIVRFSESEKIPKPYEVASNVQYSLQKEGGANKHWCEYLQAKAYSIRYKCRGIKACEYLAPEIKSFVHTSVQKHDWQTVMSKMNGGLIRATCSKQKETTTLYYAIQKAFIKHRFCIHPATGQATCSNSIPILRTYSEKVIGSYINKTAVFCSNLNLDQKVEHHFFHKINNYDSYNNEYLHSLFEYGYEGGFETCNSVFAGSSTRRKCGQNHLQGEGKIIIQPCNVRFYIVVPLEPYTTPYTIVASFGTHSHPPPPITKTPHYLMAQLQKVISKKDTLNLTTNGFLQSDELRLWVKTMGGKSLIDIHASFNNMSILTAILKKEQLLNYPAGRDFSGVIYEYHLNHKGKENPYIRYLWNDGTNLLIITFFQEQARLFSEIDIIDCDMSFKRVHGTINEWVVVVYLERYEKAIVLCRVYMNSDSKEAYLKMFDTLFRCLGEANRKELRFAHIHGYGLLIIRTDMCSKQASALGTWFEVNYPMVGLSWQEHIQSIMLYCLVHFYRGIQEKFPQHEQYFQMRALPELHSKEACINLLTELGKIPELDGWARHKAQSCVLSGLNKHCSKIQIEKFEIARKTSNLVESAHHQINMFSGKQQSLLGAIMRYTVRTRIIEPGKTRLI